MRASKETSAICENVCFFPEEWMFWVSSNVHLIKHISSAQPHYTSNLITPSRLGCTSKMHTNRCASGELQDLQVGLAPPERPLRHPWWTPSSRRSHTPSHSAPSSSCLPTFATLLLLSYPLFPLCPTHFSNGRARSPSPWALSLVVTSQSAPREVH